MKATRMVPFGTASYSTHLMEFFMNRLRLLTVRVLGACALLCMALAMIAIPTKVIMANTEDCMAVCGEMPDRESEAFAAWFECIMSNEKCADLVNCIHERCGEAPVENEAEYEAWLDCVQNSGDCDGGNASLIFCGTSWTIVFPAVCTGGCFIGTCQRIGKENVTEVPTAPPGTQIYCCGC